MFPTKEVKISVSKLLSLSTVGDEQDWAIESADKDRIMEFLTILEANTATFHEHYAIVELILASYDNFLSSGGNNTAIWRRIVEVLEKGGNDYREILQYWALAGERNTDDLFSITPLVRRYLETNGEIID